MSTTIYVKNGRRYVPISEYDSRYLGGFRMGSTLVVAKPGCISSRPIEPNFAAMIAAGTYARDKIAYMITQASEATPKEKPTTEAQQDAWKAMKKAYNQDIFYISYPSAMEAVDAGLDEMRKEAETMLQNPAVRSAYDQFMMIWQLTKDQTSTSI